MALYAHFVTRTVTVLSSAQAEAVQLTEKIFRSVNIALVNELKLRGDGDQCLGGDRGGDDEAVRMHAPLPQAFGAYPGRSEHLRVPGSPWLNVRWSTEGLKGDR